LGQSFCANKKAKLSFVSQKRQELMKGTKKRAFTLIEVLLIVAIIGTLLALLVPTYTNILEKARANQAITDIIQISRKLDDFLTDNGTLPETLEELIQDSKPLNLTDPWGNPYEYLVILGKKKNEIQGMWRKDRFMVPINSDYDLYSMGKDGSSVAPLTARASWDDIVRASDGDYVGYAHKF
jgi:general secretion pathway protein G